MNKILLIGTVSRLTNTPVQTIKNWVHWGWIEEGDRIPVGRGVYEYATFNPETVEIINRAKALKAEGMMIKKAFEIATKEKEQS